MRFLVTVTWDTETGNALAREGKLASTVRAILEELHPEQAYFPAQDGYRACVMIVNLDDASQMPAIAEPWFLATNGRVQIQPVMTIADLTRGEKWITAAASRY